MTQLLLRSVTVSLALVSSFGCQRDDRTKELSVFAASSLTEAFEDLETEFEAQHPSVDVRLTFAGSQILRLQLESGANADLFASANEDHAQALADAGLVSAPTTFAHNELVIIVPREGSSMTSFDELANVQRIVVGDESVPIGRYTQQVLDRAKKARGADFARSVSERIVSRESNVRLVRAKVELGEADAAFVYRTDAVASQSVRSIEIPQELNVRARYPIARLAASKHGETAEAFIGYVKTDAGKATLRRHGFSTEDR